MSARCLRRVILPFSTLCAIVIALYARKSRTSRLVFAGSAYGGWWYDATELASAPVVFSFGLGEDTSWDEALVAKGATVYGFDPTPKSVAYVQQRAELHSRAGRFIHVAEGLSTTSGSTEFTLPRNQSHVSMRKGVHAGSGKILAFHVHDLRTFMKRFGLRCLDVLKIDIELSEYDVLEQLIQQQYFPFAQLLVEFHENARGLYRLRYTRILEELHRAGFAVVNNVHDRELTLKNVRSATARASSCAQ